MRISPRPPPDFAPKSLEATSAVKPPFWRFDFSSEVFDRWSATADTYKPKECRSQWNSFKTGILCELKKLMQLLFSVI
jgi:hypothetical protein